MGYGLRGKGTGEVAVVGLRPARGPARVAVGLGALAALLAGPGVLLANGGALRLANVVMGDYRVSVFTDPTPVRPDSLDVSVLVLQEGVEGVPDGLDVSVRTEFVEAHRDHGGADLPGSRTLIATREQADDPRYYAAKFALGAEGRWRITVAVGGEAGSGEASFEVTARERGFLGHPLTLLTLALLPLLGAALWVLREDAADEGRAAPTGSEAAPPST
jgi:hypothetical protein